MGLSIYLLSGNINMIDFITSAQADTLSSGAGSSPNGGGFQLLIMLVIFVFFIYFTVWRPQNKRAKEHRDLLNALAKGDEVVTAGGILGKVTKITDKYVVLSVSDNNNVEMTLQKSSITTVLPKGSLKSI